MTKRKTNYGPTVEKTGKQSKLRSLRCTHLVKRIGTGTVIVVIVTGVVTGVVMVGGVVGGAVVGGAVVGEAVVVVVAVVVVGG